MKLTIAERENAGAWNEAKARTELDALQSALVEEARNRAAAEALALEVASTPRNVVQPRLRDEVSGVFESLLPRIALLRSSPEVIAAEFSDRRFLYRALAELSSGDEGLPTNWKKLRGIPDWIERHISNGQDDSGRIYARLDEDRRLWEVLVSHKGEQLRDISWLRNFN
mgnify:CR=1 FL=1